MLLYRFKENDTQTSHKKKGKQRDNEPQKRIHAPLHLDLDSCLPVFVYLMLGVLAISCLFNIFETQGNIFETIFEMQGTEAVKEEKTIKEAAVADTQETNRLSSSDLPKQLNVTVDKENPNVDFRKLCPDLMQMKSDYNEVLADVYLGDERIVNGLPVAYDVWNAYECCNDLETKTYNLTVRFSVYSEVFSSDMSEIGTVPLTLTVKR